MRKTKLICLVAVSCLIGNGSLALATASASTLRAGFSKKDITFFASGRGMMGYGDLAQKTRGIESRLFARTAVLETSGTERLAITVVDLCFVVSLLKDAVLKKLDLAQPGSWSSANLMILATHTHSGPGGIAQHDIYNVTSQGFDTKNFETIASGIAASVLEATERLVPAQMKLGLGELRGASINRSLEPYHANPDAKLYADETDPTHTVLGFVSREGRPLGLVDFFAVHNTSMSKHNRLISGDNKGWAARKVEESFGRDFVAAFGNANEGDASPNIFKGSSDEKDLEDLEKTLRVAAKQAKHALELWQQAVPVEIDSLKSRHRWVEMPRFACEPAMGESFAAGADDGPSGIPGFFEGMRQGELRPLPQYGAPLVAAVRAIVGSSRGDEKCQYPKPILFAGDARHPRILPRTLPFQVFAIGPVLIVAAPAELTTMSGRRIREAVLSQAASISASHVVIAGLANDYSGYVSTPEEYAFQHYEGAHTLYGPKTFDVHLATFLDLAQSLRVAGLEDVEDLAPLYFRPLGNFLYPTKVDGKAPWERVGKFLRQPPPSSSRGDELSFVVRSGLPSRFRDQGSIFVLEKKRSTGWVRHELPSLTQIEWSREKIPLCFNCSRLELRMPSSGLGSGEYRVLQRGLWQPLVGSARSYQSESRAFSIAK
jgi:neutral ceramidase